MRFSLLVFSLLLLVPHFGFAAKKSIECPLALIEYSYRPVYPGVGKRETEKVTLELPALDSLKKAAVTDEKAVRKTVFALKLIASFERAIGKFDHRRVYRPYPWFPPIYRPLLDASGLPRLAGQPYDVAEEAAEPAEDQPRVGAAVMPRPGIVAPEEGGWGRNRQLAAIFKAEFEAYRDYLAKDRDLKNDEELKELVALGLKLATNMETWHPRPSFMESGMRGGVRALSMAAPAAAGLSVTAGGAQDAGHFRKVIEEGGVPEVKAFSAEGLLRELNLNIPFGTRELLAVKPSYLVDPAEKLIYVQLSMNSSVTDADFKRNPTNVTVALDISGSMGANDGTAYSRIEWAKASLKTMLRKLKKGDTVSIILFDENTEVFLEPTEVSKMDLAALEMKIQSEIAVRGSTDVEKAMELALKFAKRQMAKRVAGRPADAQVENRIVLISDAGHNTGGSRENILALGYQAADAGIGTTVIGLGVNFDQALIDPFTKAKGGNYLFVQNGEQMSGLFDRFDYLIQPVAEDFRVAVTLSGLGRNPIIERAWGVNASPGAMQADDVITVPTLFFAGEGGGAMVLAIRYGVPTGYAMPGDEPAPSGRGGTRPRRGRGGPAMPE